MGNEAHEKSARVSSVKLAKYSGADEAHEELNELVNGKARSYECSQEIKGDRCTVIVSTPNQWGGSFGGHPGHCGIALWNSGNRSYQSFGILSDGTFADEEVNARNDTIKKDPAFKIWYFTRSVDATTYESLRTRMATLGKKKVVYGKFFVARGWTQDGGYSCVTAVDTILCAGGLSAGLASQLATPYAYAQTFTRLAWEISYADGHKHM